MLPLQNLDDRFFEEIVTDARSKIPKLIEQWTDQNAHDPGITFIELFSWLTEMQQYYLNRVTVKNKLAFLKLLGVRLRQATSARTDVTFSNITTPMWLPRGTKLTMKRNQGQESSQELGQTFETESSLWLLPAKIERVLVNYNQEMHDLTSSNSNAKAVYYAFGAEVNEGNRLLIAFDRELPTTQAITLTVELFENYPVPLNKTEDGSLQIIPSAQVQWEYFGVTHDGSDANANANANAGTGSKEDWQPLTVEADETFQLSTSGRITFRIPTPMQPLVVHPAKDKPRYWIQCKVVKSGYEVMPKIHQVALNTMAAVHTNTYGCAIEQTGTGTPGQMLEVDHDLARPAVGYLRVQVQEPDGDWLEWEAVTDLHACGPEDLCFTVSQSPSSGMTQLTFGDGTHGKVLPVAPVRVLVTTPEFAEPLLFGRSNGLPQQRFEIQIPSILPEHLKLQVGVWDADTKRMRWQDWFRVDDFEHSGPEDRHFVFDVARSEIQFGNNEQGEIPDPMPDPREEQVPGVWENKNLRLISLVTGGGERGNIKPDSITGFVTEDAFGDIEVKNLSYATGGIEQETLEQAISRARKELKLPRRAVTAENFEEIARKTPGLRVARVKAIPLYHPGMPGYPEQKAPGVVTVVVVPFSETQKPLPSPGFLQTVTRHVEQHRLLTTEVHVVAPEYVKITVNAIVVVQPAYKDQADKIVNLLNQYLWPFDPEQPEQGWEFGRPVYKGDVYGVINRMTGVEYIQDLWFDALGNGIQTDVSGDILLPPHGLVYSGAHQIQLISQTDL